MARVTSTPQSNLTATKLEHQAPLGLKILLVLVILYYRLYFIVCFGKLNGFLRSTLGLKLDLILYTYLMAAFRTNVQSRLPKTNDHPPGIMLNHKVIK